MLHTYRVLLIPVNLILFSVLVAGIFSILNFDPGFWEFYLFMIFLIIQILSSGYFTWRSRWIRMDSDSKKAEDFPLSRLTGVISAVFGLILLGFVIYGFTGPFMPNPFLDGKSAYRFSIWILSAFFGMLQFFYSVFVLRKL